MLAGLVVGLGRNRDAAGRRHRLEADGDVHTIPEYLVFIGDHIAHMDAEAELHDAIGRKVMIAFHHQRLHRDRSLDRPDHARELEQESIAGVFHQTATMVKDDRIDRGPMGLERGMRTRLVRTHHARVAGDISTDDGGEASFHNFPASRNRQPPRYVVGQPNPTGFVPGSGRKSDRRMQLVQRPVSFTSKTRR